ncbi:hypothetical protein EJ03DRAFT_353131 [Teratosphaeria nubilosa]|uniref:Uncharacterized protein n=1 Tax=Teratosphaeria nubilosa TaxID=161662 RepID=A0A6G1L3T9_9PEZI|nr:hypothetical protein EJ03DRAFT_353131 [Teratosphaeria nubilosa]
MTKFSSRLPQPSSPMQRARSIREETPRKLPIALNRPRPIVPEPVKTSSYEAAHLDEPCTVGALMHVLEPCGHRLLTVQPELCAANCQHLRSADQLRPHCQFHNPKDLSAPFICPTCVDAEVKKEVFQILKSWTASGISCPNAHRDSSFGVVKAVDPTTRTLCEKIANIRAGHELTGRKCYAYEDERMLYHPDTLPAPKSIGQAILAYGVRIYEAVVCETLEKKKREIDQGGEAPEQSATLQSIDSRSLMNPRVEPLQDEVGRLKRRSGKARSRSSLSSSDT